MARTSCRYIVKPTELINSRAIPDSVYRKYDQLLEQAWIETGAQYAYVTLSNEQLGKMWEVSADGARAVLTEMRRCDLIESEQIGRTGRMIRLKVAWRSKGTDSAPETNQPEQRAASQVPDPATATVAPAQQNDEHPIEGAPLGSTLAVNSNSIVVGTNDDSFRDNLYQQQSTGKGAKNSRTLEETERIVNALWDLDIRDESAVDVILGKIPEMFRGRPRDFAHVTPEFVEDWVLHRRLTAKRGSSDLLGDGECFEYALGGGYYRMQIREKRKSQYRMSDRQRAEYRANWDTDAASAVDDSRSEAEPEDEGERAPLDEPAQIAVDPPAPQSLPYRADGTAEIWDRALGELKLQMTKATFDTWVRPSRALGWDDATGELVVSVHSPYAKEWLEARLTTTVLQTVRGIVERDIAIRYEVGGK